MIETLHYGPWRIGATYNNVILHFGKRRFVVDLHDAFRANRLAEKHPEVSFQMFEQGFMGLPLDPISFRSDVEVKLRLNHKDAGSRFLTLLDGYCYTRIPWYIDGIRTFEVTTISIRSGLVLAHAYGMRTCADVSTHPESTLNLPQHLKHS